MVRTYIKRKRHESYEKRREYYIKNRERVLLNRRIDKEFKYYAKLLENKVGYRHMLDAFRYIKKTYYN